MVCFLPVRFGVKLPYRQKTYHYINPELFNIAVASAAGVSVINDEGGKTSRGFAKERRRKTPAVKRRLNGRNFSM